MFLTALSLAPRGVEIEIAMFIIFLFTFSNLLFYQEIKKTIHALATVVRRRKRRTVENLALERRRGLK
jgi:hypothetical protein